MLDIDTPFHRRVKKLKAPTSAAFDAAAWAALLDGEPPSHSDLELVAAAMLIAAEMQALRGLPAEQERDSLDAATETALCVAAMNTEYLTIMELSEDASRQAIEAGALSFGHITGAQFETGSGQKVDALTMIDTTVDASESWLFDIDPTKTAVGSETSDLRPLATRIVKRYSMQYGLNAIWKQCLWEGWRPTPAQGVNLWGPKDVGLAKLLEATRVREAENLMNYPHIDQATWKMMDPEGRRKRALPRTVVQATTSPRWRVKIGRPDCLSKFSPPFVTERAALEGSYLKYFLDHPLPELPGRNCRDLLAAWHVILDLALLLAKQLKGIEALTRRDIKRRSLQVSAAELRRILAESLLMSEQQAGDFVEFFAFRPKLAGQKGTRGLWAAPLVPIPGTDSYALAFPVLANSNPPRKVEMWLEKGGLDDSSLKQHRGDTYEAEYRAAVRAAIARNSAFSNVRCAEREIKATSDFGEQIDLLIRLGDLLIVGEVKCWLFPADPFERFQHFGKLKAAAKQAVRKVAAIRARPDVAAKALGLDVAEVKALRTVPIVVSNQGFGFSLEIEGSRVVEADFLTRYLGGGSLIAGASIDIKTGQMVPLDLTLYETEKQAADRFEATVAKPALLYRFVDRIDLTFMPFPSLIGAKTTVTIFNLSDIKGDERLYGQMLASA
ncbi:MAG: hypothetical protein QHD01_02810 [Bradyrhizobium sp.]|uniref:hypothetical protein n=1 Tax=Bradyrhizobium sp. TaxID=376 RepID=UPI0029A12C97|nr:hypothetical protein [Bradyrhizobium sp.]MDX3965515.1 hypothetical protein [Bradyrhizobium sp.]